jgi:hypothetical protein
MLPTSAIETLLQFTPPELRDIVFEIRNMIVSIAPAALERTHHHRLTYYDPGRGGPVSAGICQIGLHSDHIRLIFVHGSFLPDPKNLLQGPEKYMRFIKLFSYDESPWEDLKALIFASAHFDPRNQRIG